MATVPVEIREDLEDKLKARMETVSAFKKVITSSEDPADTLKKGGAFEPFCQAQYTGMRAVNVKPEWSDNEIFCGIVIYKRRVGHEEDRKRAAGSGFYPLLGATMTALQLHRLAEYYAPLVFVQEEFLGEPEGASGWEAWGQLWKTRVRIVG